MMFTIPEAMELLSKADVFYSTRGDPVDFDDVDDEEPSFQTLNMNDTWGWACSWGEYIPDEDLPEAARLFWHYGWPGLLYWTSEKNDQMKSEFHDVNRFIEFVRNEERIAKEIPNSSDRAYSKKEYTIGTS